MTGNKKFIPSPIDDKNTSSEFDWLFGDDCSEDESTTRQFLHIGTFTNNDVLWGYKYYYGSNTLALSTNVRLKEGDKYSKSYDDILGRIANFNDISDATNIIVNYDLKKDTKDDTVNVELTLNFYFKNTE